MDALALAISANREAPAEAGAPGRSCVALCLAGLRSRASGDGAKGSGRVRAYAAGRC